MVIQQGNCIWIRTYLRMPRSMASRKSSLRWARANLRRTDRLSGCIRAMFSASRRMTARQAALLSLRLRALVFVHRHVEHPVEAVLDGPVGADEAAETLSGGLGAEQK